MATNPSGIASYFKLLFTSPSDSFYEVSTVSTHDTSTRCSRVYLTLDIGPVNSCDPPVSATSEPQASPFDRQRAFNPKWEQGLYIQLSEAPNLDVKGSLPHILPTGIAAIQY